MEPIRAEDAITVWAVTDGKAGNRAQAQGLAEAIARRRPTRIEQIDARPKSWSAPLPARLWHALPAPGWPRSGYRPFDLPQQAPQLVIGAGRRAAPLVAWLGRDRGAATVQILNPHMPLGAFDLVVAPEHDRLTAANTMTTIGSIGRMTADRIADAARDLPPSIRALESPCLAVLLGGPSKSARWTDADSDAIADALQRLGDSGQSLLITPSRRTPHDLAKRLETLGGYLWDGSDPNPYPGLLDRADAILVTEDSVNMASEAASTGKPVHLFPLTRVARKIRRFHDRLIAHGAARRFAGGIGQWSYPPLAEADRIAAEIDARLLPDTV